MKIDIRNHQLTTFPTQDHDNFTFGSIPRDTPTENPTPKATKWHDEKEVIICSAAIGIPSAFAAVFWIMNTFSPLHIAIGVGVVAAGGVFAKKITNVS